MVSLLIELSDEYYKKFLDIHFKTKEKKMKLAKRLLEESIDKNI